jgi:ubiquinone/menaquinone biosynthesis C-methylase UbiE
MSFDLIAPHYRWMEFVLAGRKLQRCRTQFLGQLGGAENILIVGEGNGRFLTECRRSFPQAGITCIDASRPMLALARARLQCGGLTDQGVEFLHADALQWRPPSNAYDLIVTHFFLDCFRAEQLREVIGKLATSARSGACWLLADFQVPRERIARWRARILLWCMYSFFRAITRLPAKELVAPDAFLVQAGFTLEQRRFSEWGLLHSDLWRHRALA